ALRQLAALLSGCILASKLRDLAVLPEPPKSLTEIYGALRTGKLDPKSLRCQAALATALLYLGASSVAIDHVEPLR
ncbi:MAG TPA: hypothetical protein VMF89_09655, partial [Polyangiales bacterium]|nr:hypothetical protein [Polyangiales bacterium]